MTKPRLVEYSPGQYGMLVRTGSDSRTEKACASCGKPLGYAGIAARMGDEAWVHYTREGREVLDCVSGKYFVSSVGM